MVDRDSLAERGKSLEDDYFRKKDRELVEKMRQAAAGEQARNELSRTTGLSDPALLQELQELGFTPETVVLLPLVPILQVAWAEGGITKSERDLLVSLAAKRGVAAGSPADRQLNAWLETRPADSVFAKAGRLIGAMLDAGSSSTSDLNPEDLIRYCEEIASASGGVLGFGRISAEERTLLSNIADALRSRR